MLPTSYRDDDDTSNISGLEHHEQQQQQEEQQQQQQQQQNMFEFGTLYGHAQAAATAARLYASTAPTPPIPITTVTNNPLHQMQSAQSYFDRHAYFFQSSPPQTLIYNDLPRRADLDVDLNYRDPQPGDLAQAIPYNDPALTPLPERSTTLYTPVYDYWQRRGILSDQQHHQQMLLQQQQQQQQQEEHMFNHLVSMARQRAAGNNIDNNLMWASSATLSGYGSTTLQHQSKPELAQTDFTSATGGTSTETYLKHKKVDTTNWNERRYQLVIVQQPSRARMCGYGDKDRRPISPPPILKLIVYSLEGRVIPPADVDITFFVVFCECMDEHGQHSASLIRHPASSSQQLQPQAASLSSSSTAASSTSSTAARNSDVIMKNLVGSSVASPAKLYDTEGEFGIFFVFSDLSLRCEGRFRLAFSLFNIGNSSTHTVNTASSSCERLVTVLSEAFTVYTAKNFPGVVQPTPLSQCFAKQGIKIPTRRDTKSKRKRTSSSTTITTRDEEDDQEE